MNFIFGIVVPILVFVTSFLILQQLIRNDKIVKPINPYTNKVSWIIYYYHFQMTLFITGFIIIAFNISPKHLILPFLFVLCFVTFFYFKFRKNYFGETLYIISNEENINPEPVFSETKGKLKTIKKHIKYEKLVFTDKYVFYKKRKKLSLKREKTEQLDLTNVSILGNYLVFKYSFMHSINTIEYVFYVSNPKDKELKKIIEFYNHKVK